MTTAIALTVLFWLVVIVALWNLGKELIKIVKTVLKKPAEATVATGKGIKSLGVKFTEAKLEKAIVKEARKQLDEFAIESLRNQTNDFVKTDKILKLEAKLADKA